MKKLISLIMLSLCTLTLSAGSPGIRPSSGPWIQKVTENSFTVLWCTESSTLSWVEVFPDDGNTIYSAEGRRVYQTVAGRRMSGTFHSVEVKGLEPGTSYRYRLCGKVVAEERSAYDIRYGRTAANKDIYKVRTLDSKAPVCRFSMVNDMHFHDDRYAALLKDVDASVADFVVLAGDIVSYADRIDTLIRHTFGPVAKQASGIPFFFARGNHEGRGTEWYKVPAVFPTTSGEFYYTFRQGPVAFVVLDAGEDKPDSNVEYFGQAQYDEYRQVELEWLKQVVKEEPFASAPVKVCIIHIPTFRDKDAWYAQRWISENFTPVLNEAGIDLMLSGHHHRHIVAGRGEHGNDYPIVVNSNTERLDFESDGESMHLRFYDEDGKMTREHVFNKK